MQEDGTKLLADSTQALQSGDAQEALRLADQATQLGDVAADAWVLKGIALAQLGQNSDAVEAFRQAVILNPKNEKAFYNFGTLYYRMGNKPEALAMANEAVRLDPSHAAARDLAALLESELRPAESPGPGMAYYDPSAVDPAIQFPAQVHRIGFIGRGQAAWNAVGVGIALLTLWSFFSTFDPAVRENMQRYQEAFNSGNGKITTEALEAWNALMPLFLRVFGTFLLGMVWLIMDVVDRARSWLWVVSYAVLCIGQAHILVMVAYLISTRASRPRAAANRQ